MNKSILKKALIGLAVLILLFMIIIITDFSLVSNNKRPIFVISKGENEYQGFFYTVVKYEYKYKDQYQYAIGVLERPEDPYKDLYKMSEYLTKEQLLNYQKGNTSAKPIKKKQVTPNGYPSQVLTLP